MDSGERFSGGARLALIAIALIGGECWHEVRHGSAAEVDAGLPGWIRRAFEASA